MHPVHALLAIPPDPKEIRSVYVWGAILIGVVLIAFFAYSYFKRWMNDTGDTENHGFTLSDLRKLRDQGKISAQEFEQTRANMLAAAKKMTGYIPDVTPRRQPKSPDAGGDPTGPTPPVP